MTPSRKSNRVMGTETISKSEASLKSQTSRRNLNILALIMLFMGIFTFKSCIEESEPESVPAKPENISFSYKATPDLKEDSLKIGETVMFSVRPVNGADSYEWEIYGPTEWSVNEKSNTVETQVPNQTGKYTVTVSAKNKNGSSERAKEEFTVFNPAIKTPPAKPGQISCNPNKNIYQTSDSIEFSIVPIENATSYVWTVSGPAYWSITNESNSVSTKIPDQAGKYTISVASKNQHGVSNPSSIEIEVQLKEEEEQDVPQAVIDLISEPEPFQEAEPYLLRTEVVPGSEREYTNMEEIEGVIYTTDWRCETKKYSASENPDQFFMFNPLASVLWPGNLIQGKSIASGVPTSIPVSKRKSGNISFAIVSPDKEGVMNMYYRTVEKMQFSYVNQAMNEVLSGYGGHGTGKYYFEMDFVETASDFNFKLNTGYSGGVINVSTKFGTNWSDKKSRILVKLTQQYYTMVYDDPEGINGVFTPDITANDLKNYCGNGNPMCYISSVTYGRVYFLLYESTASKQELNAALNFAYNGWGSAYVDSEADYKKVMGQTIIKLIQVGGDAADGLNTATAPDLQKIQTFLSNGANFSPQSPGEPISYTIKYLKDASLVRMNNTMEYEVEQCEAVAVSSDKDIFNIKINDYTVSATHSNDFGYCRHYLGIDIGEINNVTGGTDVIVRYPENETYKNYGNSTGINFSVNYNAGKVPIARENSLFIRFRVYNETEQSHQITRIWGHERVYDRGNGSYEKTIYFDYIPAENKWVAREDNDHFRSVTFTSPNINSFYITNTINYSIIVE